VSQATAARPVPPPADGGDGLRLTPVTICDAAGVPTRGGMTLLLDTRGVVLVEPAGDERVLPWPRVTGWQVEAWQPQPGIVGALVTYRTQHATYRFGVPRADPGALGYLVEQLGHGYVSGRGGPTPAVEPPAPAASAIEERVRRLRPVLVVVLVVVLVLMVTLILLQSAGVIHLPWLGGNGSGGPSGRGLPVSAGLV
jgi:hypothetical protein